MFFLAGIVLITLMVWYGMLSAPFFFDDRHTVQENMEIRDLANCRKFLGNFFSRGLLKVGFALNYAIVKFVLTF